MWLRRLWAAVARRVEWWLVGEPDREWAVRVTRERG